MKFFDRLRNQGNKKQTLKNMFLEYVGLLDYQVPCLSEAGEISA